jgi:transcription initiation factor TFIIH subunit 2
VLLLDFSKAALKIDFKPSRLKLIYMCTQAFSAAFTANNPLSRLEIAIVKNGLSRRLNDLEDLQQMCAGEFSLQNALELGAELLGKSTLHWCHELLVIQNALWSCDPGDIWETVGRLVEANVQVSVLSFAPELYLSRKVTELTGGSFSVAKNEADLKEKWLEFTSEGSATQGTALVPMAFPMHSADQVLCACHSSLRPCYVCPVCRARVCSIPSSCPVCSFTLVSSPHLVKASLSLAPIPEFPTGEEAACSACSVMCKVSKQCPDCHKPFCGDCEDFIKTVLGRCLGCAL